MYLFSRCLWGQCYPAPQMWRWRMGEAVPSIPAGLGVRGMGLRPLWEALETCPSGLSPYLQPPLSSGSIQTAPSNKKLLFPFDTCWFNCSASLCVSAGRALAILFSLGDIAWSSGCRRSAWELAAFTWEEGSAEWLKARQTLGDSAEGLPCIHSSCLLLRNFPMQRNPRKRASKPFLPICSFCLTHRFPGLCLSLQCKQPSHNCCITSSLSKQPPVAHLFQKMFLCRHTKLLTPQYPLYSIQVF